MARKYKAGDILKFYDTGYYIMLLSRHIDEYGIAWWKNVSLTDGNMVSRGEEILNANWVCVA